MLTAVLHDAHVDAWREWRHGQARQFLQRLDPEAERFTFQTFDDTPEKRRELAKVLHRPFDKAATLLDGQQEWRAGVFVTINATDGKGRQAHNVERVRAVFVDLDGAPLQPVLEAGLEPHIVVESSPGRFHAYWLVDDCALDRFERVQKALAQRFGGDPSVHDLPRVMRLPGFRHFKKDAQTTKLIDGIGTTAPAYLLAEIVGSLQLELDAPAKEAAKPKANGSGKITEPGRTAHLWAIGRSLASRSTPEAVHAALTAENATRCDPPLSDAKIADLVRRAFTAKDAPGYEAPIDVTKLKDAGVWRDDAPAARPWPEPLTEAAYHGLAGEITRAIAPNTESDPAAILVQTLIAFGAYVARGPHVRVEGDQHHANLFVVLVGATAKARKGTSWSRVRQPFQLTHDWKPTVSGLSSGEGLKYNVRDAREETKKNKAGQFVTEVVDEGVTDKRLLVIESEFAQALRAMQRQGNTLSSTVREAWDSGRLATLVKNDPITATGAHIAIIAHITADELRAEMSATDTANGFANRFLFVAVKRSNVLPFGGNGMSEHEIDDFASRITALRAIARSRDVVQMTPAARKTWAAVYPTLSEGRPGLLGSVTARAEAQCLRLALVYALLDGADHIDRQHLLAALAVWEYCDATARYIFGDALGDRIADEILRSLRAAGTGGRTRTELSTLFNRHESAARIGQALELLKNGGKAKVEMRATGGRPEEVWTAVYAKKEN